MILRYVVAFAFCAALACAQPTFEVASVKPIDTNILETRPTRTPARFTWTTDLWYLTSYAWKLPRSRISGPIPGSSSIYQVDATMSPSATEDQVREMLRTLLETRFKLVSHIATKDVDGFALAIGKGGLKVKEARADDVAMAPFIAPTMPERNVALVTAHHVPVQELANMLQVSQKEMVWDETGLTENYDFTFRYAIGDDPNTEAPILATALRETLGLDYKKHHGAVDSLFVDSIEKLPTEN